MSWEAVVEAVASGTGASIGVAALARRWFRQAVGDVVDKRVARLERDVEAHLRRQDERLASIERKVSPRR